MRKLAVIGASAVVAAMFGQDAHAGAPVRGPAIEVPVVAAPAVAAEAAARTASGPGQPISDSDLANLAGGETKNVFFTLTNQNLEATASGNSISAGTVTSGAVNFASDAFSGFNGIGNFVVNTGNNNILQGSLSVTVIGGQ